MASSSNTHKAAAAAAAGGEVEEKKGALFEPIFSQKEEIILLKELQDFRKEFGEKNDWKLFYKMSNLREQYSEPQITNKMRRLKDKFQNSKGPPRDGCDSRVYELSQSLWGEEARAPSPEDFPHLVQLFTVDPTSPELLRTNPSAFMTYKAAVELEKECEDLYTKEVELLLQKWTLKLKVVGPLLQNIKQFAAESSSSGN